MKYASLSHFLRGALTVEFRGENLSLFVPRLQQEGIRLHQVRFRQGRCICSFSLGDFEKVYTLCRQNRVKLRFIRRSGLPFLKKRALHRKAFMFGIILFFAIIYIASSMIWKIQVQASDEELIPGVLQAARSSGLFVTTWKNRLPDVLKLQEEILKKSTNLVWVGVRIQGSVASIQAVERIANTPAENRTPHNIVAAKPGVIRRVFATRGVVNVKPGQLVQPGQILVSGTLYEGTQVPANAEVLAEVWYTSTVQVPLAVRESGLTGEHDTRDYIDIGKLGLRVWGWKQPNYAASLERDSVTSWHIAKWTLPIQLRKVWEYEMTTRAEQTSVAKARSQALELAAQDVRTQIGKAGTILRQTVLQPKVSHGTLYETVLTQAEEDIGTPGNIG